MRAMEESAVPTVTGGVVPCNFERHSDIDAVSACEPGTLRTSLVRGCPSRARRRSGDDRLTEFSLGTQVPFGGEQRFARALNPTITAAPGGGIPLASAMTLTGGVRKSTASSMAMSDKNDLSAVMVQVQAYDPKVTIARAMLPLSMSSTLSRCFGCSWARPLP